MDGFSVCSVQKSDKTWHDENELCIKHNLHVVTHAFFCKTHDLVLFKTTAVWALTESLEHVLTYIIFDFQLL